TWSLICTKNITISSKPIRQKIESSELVGRSSKTGPRQPNRNRRSLILLFLVRHCAQMRVKGDPVPCPQRMFNVRKNLYAREMGSQEFAKTGASEKVFVVTFQDVPGNTFPIFEIGNHLCVGH